MVYWYYIHIFKGEVLRKRNIFDEVRTKNGFNFFIEILEEFSETTTHEIYYVYKQVTNLPSNHFAKKKKSLQTRPFYTSHQKKNLIDIFEEYSETTTIKKYMSLEMKEQITIPLSNHFAKKLKILTNSSVLFAPL